MDVSLWDTSSLLADKEPLTEEQFEQLKNDLNQGEKQRGQFKDMHLETVEKQRSALAKDAVMALKTAQGFFALSEYSEALKWLEKAGAGKQQCYLKACSLRALGNYSEAVSEFEAAESKGYDGFDIAVAIVDCLRQADDLEGAAERLKRISRVGNIRAEYHYQMGRLHEANGLHEEAIDEFERTITLNANHSEALFHLAYACDLYGLDDKAIDYYEQCIETSNNYVSALLNLAVLYEDIEEYAPALQCIMKVLAAYPNHKRARLFLKDINSSFTMYYDEDQEKRIDRRNKVLEIPMSDFELSVRSRNCLRKMNIRSLGDLLRVTETELLAYKNFGETSLQEIKAVLNAKGLRLGQMLEDHKNGAPKPAEEEQEQDAKNEVLQTSVSRLTMSVRSRKCLERLNINSVGELIKCTEAELLGCKNFGMTSLDEIKTSLKEYGMSLRQLEEELRSQ
ncbi:MAG: tetratricopeptide repeat protein [Sedimentisphaerales bacterium]|nr:tetratricopeptide repeat protein [Sedimentisphaerales bacterium]